MLVPSGLSLTWNPDCVCANSIRHQCAAPSLSQASLRFIHPLYPSTLMHQERSAEPVSMQPGLECIGPISPELTPACCCYAPSKRWQGRFRFSRSQPQKNAAICYPTRCFQDKPLSQRGFARLAPLDCYSSALTVNLPKYWGHKTTNQDADRRGRAYVVLGACSNTGQGGLLAGCGRCLRELLFF